MQATSDQDARPAGIFVLYSRRMLTSLPFNTVLVSLAVFACLIWLALSYNNLSRLRTEIDQAFERIDVHIKERHHLTPSLLEVVKQHTKEQGALFDKVMKARHTMATSAERVRAFSNDTSSINSLVNADVALNIALEQILAMQKTHPTLATDELFQKLKNNLISIEANLSFTHQLYDDVVRNYNCACAGFPSVLLAAALGFRSAGTLAQNNGPKSHASTLRQA
jgi:LemA protein